MDKKKERVVIFIDGSNFYHSSKKLNVVDKINFQKLINELVGDRELAKAFYYNSPLDISVNPKIYWKQQKFFDMLRKIPKIEVILCKQRKVKRDGKFEYEVKGDDTHLVSDLVGEAYENLYDTAIIISGDSDLIPAVQAVKETFPAKTVGVVIPIGRRAEALKQATHFHMKMKLKHLETCQLPARIELDGKVITRPKSWE